MKSFTLNAISFFETISFLEGLSYILLVFVAVPIKYIAGNAFLVRSLGMPHGVLFMMYILLALYIRKKMQWNMKATFVVLIASLIPFGTFYINKKYLKKKI